MNSLHGFKNYHINDCSTNFVFEGYLQVYKYSDHLVTDYIVNM
jgi:hypothetical protein